MDSNYRPQSPDLSSYAPRSPDLSGLHTQNQDLPGFGSAGYGNLAQQGGRLQGAFGNPGFGGQFAYPPTSVPHHSSYNPQYAQSTTMPPRSIKPEDDGEYLLGVGASAASKRTRKMKQDPGVYPMNGLHGLPNALSIKTEQSDPTLGCQLKTSFPVARIKRIMQADEDIGKVAQVTPTVVSRALELFMIKLISASAHQARGPTQPGTAGVAKGPKRVLAQHLKKAVVADDTFDFLQEIVNRVPDAPTKAKKDNGSDSEDGAKPRRKGKKRKDSMEE